jgi:hypothetical protein
MIATVVEANPEEAMIEADLVDTLLQAGEAAASTDHLHLQEVLHPLTHHPLPDQVAEVAEVDQDLVEAAAVQVEVPEVEEEDKRLFRGMPPGIPHFQTILLAIIIY